ncbi:MAG: hypothetical protein MJ252_03335 [archaeon]|nr:hypothetical protein [archaeon]
MEVYLAIVNSKLSFPPYCKDKDFKQLMVHMLCKNQANRLTKINQIKNHVWFQDFDWEELMNMNMNVPYIPVKAQSNEEPSPYRGTKFSDYCNKCYNEWKPPQGTPSIPSEKMKEYNEWWNNF